jgi:hypothetical protein
MDIVGWELEEIAAQVNHEAPARGSTGQYPQRLTWLAMHAMAVSWDAAEGGCIVVGECSYTMIDRRWSSNSGAAEVSPEFAMEHGALTKSER